MRLCLGDLVSPTVASFLSHAPSQNVFNAPFFFKFCGCSRHFNRLCTAYAILICYVNKLKSIYNIAFNVTSILNRVYFLLFATFLFQSLSPLDGHSSRSPTTLRNLGESSVAITCSLIVAGRRAIYFPDEISLLLDIFLSMVRFFYLFLKPFTHFSLFFYHLLLRPGTDKFFGNRRCDFQQSNVAMLVFCFFCIA